MQTTAAAVATSAPPIWFVPAASACRAAPRGKINVARAASTPRAMTPHTVAHVRAFVREVEPVMAEVAIALPVALGAPRVAWTPRPIRPTAAAAERAVAMSALARTALASAPAAGLGMDRTAPALADAAGTAQAACARLRSAGTDRPAFAREASRNAAAAASTLRRTATIAVLVAPFAQAAELAALAHASVRAGAPGVVPPVNAAEVALGMVRRVYVVAGAPGVVPPVSARVVKRGTDLLVRAARQFSTSAASTLELLIPTRKIAPPFARKLTFLRPAGWATRVRSTKLTSVTM